MWNWFSFIRSPPKGLLFQAYISVSFLLLKYFQNSLKIFYIVPVLHSSCIKHKICTHVLKTFIYKTTTVNELSTPSTGYCLTLDPESIIFMALKVHVSGLWQWTYYKMSKWQWRHMNHSGEPVSSDESFPEEWPILLTQIFRKCHQRMWLQRHTYAGMPLDIFANLKLPYVTI